MDWIRFSQAGGPLRARRAIASTRLASPWSAGQNGSMNSDDLTREQVEAILARLTPTLGYLTRLSARMDRKGFADDPFAAEVRKAQRTMQDLRAHLHALGCNGMGNKRRAR